MSDEIRPFTQANEIPYELLGKVSMPGYQHAMKRLLRTAEVAIAGRTADQRVPAVTVRLLDEWEDRIRGIAGSLNASDPEWMQLCDVADEMGRVRRGSTPPTEASSQSGAEGTARRHKTVPNPRDPQAESIHAGDCWCRQASEAVTMEECAEVWRALEVASRGAWIPLSGDQLKDILSDFVSRRSPTGRVTVVPDESVPPGEARFVDPATGKTLGRITGLGDG